MGHDQKFDVDKLFATYRETIAKTDPFIVAVSNASLDVEAHLGEFLEDFIFHPADLENAPLRYLSEVYLARSLRLAGPD